MKFKVYIEPALQEKLRIYSFQQGMIEGRPIYVAGALRQIVDAALGEAEGRAAVGREALENGREK